MDEESEIGGLGEVRLPLDVIMSPGNMCMDMKCLGGGVGPLQEQGPSESGRGAMVQEYLRRRVRLIGRDVFACSTKS